MLPDKKQLDKQTGLKRVLLVYGSQPPIMDYLAAAFQQRRISVEMVYTDKEHWINRSVIRVINKQLHNLRLLPKGKNVFNGNRYAHKNFRSNSVLEACRRFGPDLVLIIRGLTIREDILSQVKQHAQLFGWWTIGEERMDEAFSEMRFFDWYFFMNSSCIEAGAQTGGSKHP